MYIRVVALEKLFERIDDLSHLERKPVNLQESEELSGEPS